MRMRIDRLIDDLGGASRVAEICEVQRTAPYGWVNRNYISQRMLERIKRVYPELDLDAYFEPEDQDDHTANRS